MYYLELRAPGNDGSCEADTINGDVLAFINSGAAFFMQTPCARSTPPLRGYVVHQRRHKLVFAAWRNLKG
jgi:hypothetical protein